MAKKVLAGKNYGSIPHLPNSKLGPGDHSIHAGQARIATIKTRDKHDTVIVQEKLDGSNVGVIKIDGRLIPVTRAGYPAESSPHKQHHYFSKWVYKKENHERFNAVLKDGERLVGEWLLQAHGTRYAIPSHSSPFVAIDILRGKERLPNKDFKVKTLGLFYTPLVVHAGDAVSVQEVYEKAILVSFNFFGRIDPLEGVVYRVERKGVVDFVAKWVRQDYVPGKYFPENNNGEILWNISPESIL